MSLRQTLTDSIGIKFIEIEPGQFMMGSPSDEEERDNEETQHRVRLTRPFLMGVHEVTRGQFARFVQDGGYRTDAEKEGWAYAFNDNNWNKISGASWRNPGFEQGDSHPVVCVSWTDAVALCQWLSRKEGKSYRLPTEAEWEYACRAGSSGRFSFGDAHADLHQYGNYADCSTAFEWSDKAHSDGQKFTAPGGSYRANAWGLHDMHGNVWEWCSDWYGQYPRGEAVDPTGPAKGACRVLRGGSWARWPKRCRSAARVWITPDYRNNDLGFRLVLDLD